MADPTPSVETERKSKWGLFVPGADGPYETFTEYNDALTANAAGPRDAFVAPLDIWEAMALAWNDGAAEGLRTPPHLGYALRNPYREQLNRPGTDGDGQGE